MNSRPFGQIAIACLFSSLSVTPLLQASAAIAQTQFADASNHWAAPFISGLSQRNIINGFPDGSFRPDELVTRAQFATIVQQAFNTPSVRASRSFNDVNSSYWAAPAINQSYSEGFLSGYTDGSFQPDQPIPKVQALVAISSGLNLQSVGSIDNTLLRFYDAREIPNYAKAPIAAATERNIPVNYPNASVLNPNQPATRADVAALIYQTLVSQGKVAPVGTNFPAAQFVVQGGGLAANSAAPGNSSLPLGTEIPVELSGAEPGAKLVMAVGENAESALRVSRDVVDSNQQVVIPQGSVIMGRFQPFNVEKTEGTQFEATKLMIGNTPYTIHASSIPIAARKRSSFKVGDLAGSVTTLGTSILVDRLLADDGEDLNVASLVPGIIQTGRAVGSSVLNSSKTSDKLILVEPNQMGLKLNSVFEFLPASSTAFSETALSNPNQVDVGTLVTLSAATADSKYVLVPDESMDLEFKTARAIFNRQGQVLIPEGSLVKGRVEPVEINGDKGAQFIANTLVLGTQSYSINAATPGISAVSLKSLSPADFHGNVIASDGASDTIRNVGGSSQSSSGGGFLGIGNLLGGSGSSKKVILLNPNTLQLEFSAPLTLNSFGS